MDHSPAVASGRAVGSDTWVCEQGLIASEAKLGNMTNILVLFFLHLYSGRLVCFLFKRLGLPRAIVQIIVTFQPTTTISSLISKMDIETCYTIETACYIFD